MFKKFLIMIFIFCIAFSCCSCGSKSQLNDADYNKILSELENKYHCTFHAYENNVAEDLDTLNGVYFFSDEFPDCPFEVEYENNSIKHEDYIRTIMEHKRENYINEMIQSKGIDCITFCSLPCDDTNIPAGSEKIDIDLFIKTYCNDLDPFISYTLLKETNENNHLLEEIAVTLSTKLSKDVYPKTQSTCVFSIPEEYWDEALKMFLEENPSYNWEEKIHGAKRF